MDYDSLFGLLPFVFLFLVFYSGWHLKREPNFIFFSLKLTTVFFLLKIIWPLVTKLKVSRKLFSSKFFFFFSRSSESFLFP
jgi:hypothetical protein